MNEYKITKGQCTVCKMGDEDDEDYEEILENGLCGGCRDSPFGKLPPLPGQFPMIEMETGPQRVIYCLSCKGESFKVGSGSYHTCIMCVKCGWERTIHDG